jgi:hypothetical protein
MQRLKSGNGNGDTPLTTQLRASLAKIQTVMS